MNINIRYNLAIIVNEEDGEKIYESIGTDEFEKNFMIKNLEKVDKVFVDNDKFFVSNLEIQVKDKQFDVNEVDYLGETLLKRLENKDDKLY